MQRRLFLLLATTLPVLGTTGAVAQTAAKPGAKRTIGEMRSEWKQFLAANANVPAPAPPLKLAPEDWRKRLSAEQYRVLREEGTEPPGSSKLNAEKRRGVYACAGCGLPLFTSEMKYESGTGWPSYFTTIPGVFGIKEDRILLYPRTEYHCVRCGGHHGHIFKDGPAPTFERWCNNGLALTFIPA